MNGEEQITPFTVTIHPLWTSEDNSDFGVSSINVHLDPGPDVLSEKEEIRHDNALKVGIYESSPLGAGNQLRLSIWLAAAVLAQEVQRPLIGARIDIDVTGQIDGPSAGGLLTVALLAAWNKVKILPRITMTGTILPNGSIGPVGGIPSKIKAAANEKFEAVIVPDCQHIEYDPETDKVIDIEDVGNENKIKVIFVSDVKEAYQALTGEKIEEIFQTPPPTAEPSFPKETRDAFREEAIRLYVRCDNAFNKHNEVGTYTIEDDTSRSVFNDYVDTITDGYSQIMSEMLTGNWIAVLESSFETLVMLKGLSRWINKSFQIEPDLALESSLSSFNNYIFCFRNESLAMLEAQFTNVIEKSFMKAHIDSYYVDILRYISWLLEGCKFLKEAYSDKVFRKKGFLKRLLEDESDENDPQNTAIYFSVLLTLYKEICLAYPRTFCFPKAFYPKDKCVIPEIPKSICYAWLNFYSTRNEILSEHIISYIQFIDENQEEEQTCLTLASHYLDATEFLLKSEAKKRGKMGDSCDKDDIVEILESLAFQMALGVELASSLVELELQPITKADGKVDKFVLSGALTKMLEDSHRKAKMSICQVQAEGSFALAATWNYFIAISNERGKPEEKIEALKAFWLAEGLARLQLLCTARETNTNLP